LLGEYDAAGVPRQETVYLGSTPVAVLQGTTLYFVHADHLDTPRVITDRAGTVVWRWDSDPFGTTPADADPDGDGQAFTYHLRFPGQYFDAETGLHYNYFRDYDPSTGRYVQSDPIGLAGGMNTYAYVGNDPVNWVDPRGLEAVIPLPPVAGAAGGASAAGGTIAGIVGPITALIGGLIYSSPAGEGSDIVPIMESNFPPGYWLGDKGAAEWGRRNDVGTREGKGRFHGIKQGCPGSKATDDFGVNPETGDVVDPAGDVVGNLGDVKSK
jgi:RHS repeat-associated protein